MRKMEKEENFTRKERRNILIILKTIRNKDLADIYIIMVSIIKASGLRMNPIAEADKFIKMELFIKVIR